MKAKSIKEHKKARHMWYCAEKEQKGGAVERDELEEDRATFIACEIGGVVIQLIIEGVEINRDSIVDYLEAKRKAVGNVIHKGLLRDSAAMVRKGRV